MGSISRPIDLEVVRKWDGAVVGSAVDLETVRDPVAGLNLRAMPARKPGQTNGNKEPGQEKQRPPVFITEAAFFIIVFPLPFFLPLAYR